jgi:hypothetical protein
MAGSTHKKRTIDQIIKAAQKLDKLDLQILLTKLRIKKMQRDGVKPAVSLHKGAKPPSIEEIDLWKHESRKNYKGR